MHPQKQKPSRQPAPLRIIPFYTGLQSLEALRHHPASLRLLWLEILLNGDFPWEDHRHHSEVEAAYQKAALWYTHYKTMIDGLVGRPPFEEKTGKIDEREIRKFQEAVNFVSD